MKKDKKSENDENEDSEEDSEEEQDDEEGLEQSFQDVPNFQITPGNFNIPNLVLESGETLTQPTDITPEFENLEESLTTR